MTQDAYFYTDQSLLKFVLETLNNFPEEDIYEYSHLSLGIVCLLSCSAAFEAMVNKILIDCNHISHWDELKILSKVDTIIELSNQKLDWGSYPLQNIQKLFKIRNWLAHNKESYIGLLGFGEKWVPDRISKTPKIDPRIDFGYTSIKTFYNAVRDSILSLAELTNLTKEFYFLKTEEYKVFIF